MEAARAGRPSEGVELVLDMLLREELSSRYRVDEEAEEYRRLVIAGLEKLGVRRYREATELAYATAWLLDARECRVDNGRGADMRALAAVAVYWVWLVEYARGALGQPKAQIAWELTGSSRASFYRAVRVWSSCMLGLDDHKLLLRGEARVALHASRVASYPGHFIIVLRGYIPAAAGAHRLRLGRLAPAELLLLPLTDSTRRARTMNGRVTVTFDYEELYELIRRNFDYEPFTTSQFAKLLALHFPSAAQLLKRLETLGMVERLDDGVWKLREKPRAEPNYPAYGGSK